MVVYCSKPMEKGEVRVRAKARQDLPISGGMAVGRNLIPRLSSPNRNRLPVATGVRQVFYVNDTSKGKNWRHVEQVRHRGVWDVPEQDDVSNNAFQQDEPTDGIPIRAGDTNISYNKDDVDLEIVGDDELMEDHIDDNNDGDDTLAEYVDDKEDELNRQPDFDIDLDIDCDI
ncbi:hypothetical protein RHSIM_Rhsim12G0098200 [Rhododendron simsii]|uniref:Uncharacterized protein n=1 Tax=Rhododendron simsii TaxID=118357 RepID=A0A834G3C7_RHOSS|nr:hypothetical protein RHSIM_Rhsim12G0098200 [Rhododendron simsii]